LQTWNAQWEEVLSLTTLPADLHYLSSRTISIHVWDQEEGYLVGVAVIGLNPITESLGVTKEFCTRLSILDETRGTVRGKYYITEYVPPPAPPTVAPAPVEMRLLDI
jgi:hypothetical protein